MQMTKGDLFNLPDGAKFWLAGSDETRFSPYFKVRTDWCEPIEYTKVKTEKPGYSLFKDGKERCILVSCNNGRWMHTVWVHPSNFSETLKDYYINKSDAVRASAVYLQKALDDGKRHFDRISENFKRSVEKVKEQQKKLQKMLDETDSV